MTKGNWVTDIKTIQAMNPMKWEIICHPLISEPVKLPFTWLLVMSIPVPF